MQPAHVLGKNYTPGVGFLLIWAPSEIASSSLQITAKNTASIKLELYYEKWDYYLEQYNRPFADSITLNLDKEEIKKKLTK